MAKIQFLDDVATFNRQTGKWECSNEAIARLLQQDLVNRSGSPDGTMHYYACKLGARVLEWDSEDRRVADRIMGEKTS